MESFGRETASAAAVTHVQGQSWIVSHLCALGSLAEGCQQPPPKCPHLHTDIPLHQGAQGTSEVLGKTGDKSRAAPGAGATEAKDVIIKEQRSIFPPKLTLTHQAGQPGGACRWGGLPAPLGRVLWHTNRSHFKLSCFFLKSSMEAHKCGL